MMYWWKNEYTRSATIVSFISNFATDFYYYYMTDDVYFIYFFILSTIIIQVVCNKIGKLKNW